MIRRYIKKVIDEYLVRSFCEEVVENFCMCAHKVSYVFEKGEDGYKVKFMSELKKGKKTILIEKECYVDPVRIPFCVTDDVRYIADELKGEKHETN